MTDDQIASISAGDLIRRFDHACSDADKKDDTTVLIPGMPALLLFFGAIIVTFVPEFEPPREDGEELSRAGRGRHPAPP